MNFNLYLQHENMMCQNTQKKVFLLLYLRPVVCHSRLYMAISKSLLFHRKFFPPIKRTEAKFWLQISCTCMFLLIHSINETQSYSLPFGEQSHHT